MGALCGVVDPVSVGGAALGAAWCVVPVIGVPHERIVLNLCAGDRVELEPNGVLHDALVGGAQLSGDRVLGHDRVRHVENERDA